MSKLYKKEVETLRKISTDRLGKKLIEEFIWLNTTKPKFKVGDKVIFTDYGHYIYKKEVINCIGTITEIHRNPGDKRYWYGLNAKYQKSGNVKIYESYHAVDEVILKKTQRKKDINIINTDCDEDERHMISINI